MDIKIASDEPYQLLSIQGINHQNTNASLDNAYLSFIKSSHQLLRYCLYSKSKSIGEYEALNTIPSNALIIDELYDILSDVYCLAEYLYSLNPSTKKYDCMAMFDGYKSDKFSKHFIVDKEFELMIQATLELYLVAIAYMDSNYVWSLAYKAFFDETSTRLKVHFENVQVAKLGSKSRWSGHVEELRRKYLDLDKKRQEKLGKPLSIKASAMWIYSHHNPEEYEFETIRDHLSKARKGLFTN